jgi:two-component system sensor histidine kinase UhpB
MISSMSLLWRVFGINALVMGTGALLLVVTPMTVSSPVAAEQAAVLAAGLAAMLALNFMLLRPYLRPLEELTGVMAEVDLLRPGARVAEPSGTPELRVVAHAFNRMLERLEEERRRSAQQALAAQEGERVRVSRELHDGVGQRLTGVLLRLQSVEERTPEPARADVAAVRAEVRASLEEVRDTARRLRPEALEDLGLSAALAALTRDIARDAPVTVERDLRGDLDGLGHELDVVVYRVAQEALTNVVRHAAAHRAQLRVHRDGDRLVLAVVDDGRGFDPAAAPAGAGLTGMQERALLVDGTLSVAAEAGAGTTVRLDVAVPRG